MTKPIRIAITGGAGQIAYNLLFRLAKGELFPGKEIALHILEVKDILPQLEGVKMELEDAAFPLLKEVQIGSDPNQVFADVEWAFLIGAKPRGPGMERKDLLLENAKIFREQGRALAASANKSVQTLVIGNPCNTNCLIAIHNAKSLNPNQFSAMTRLDENRAKALLARKSERAVASVKKLAIWGNHSTTQVPDFIHATIDGKPATDVIKDLSWLEGEFCKLVQNRGAEIIKARGKSSAASAASAALDAMRAVVERLPKDDWYSAGIYSAGNSYGIDPDLVFSFPCVTENNVPAAIQGVEWNPFLQKLIKASEKELLEERELIKDLLN